MPPTRTDAEERLAGFILADKGVVALVDQDGTRLARLAPGEAIWTESGVPRAVVGIERKAPDYYDIAIVPATEIAEGDQAVIGGAPFLAPTGDAFDVDLIRDLLNRGDYSRHYSDDVVVEVRGTDQRYRGREAAKNWVEGIHAVGEIKVRNTFMGETHAVAEAEFIRKDGILVPYSVIYDVAAGKITALRLYFTGPVQP